MAITRTTSSLLRMRSADLARVREKMENVKEGEEIQRLRDLHLQEQSAARQRLEEQKRSTMQAHLVSSAPCLEAVCS